MSTWLRDRPTLLKLVLYNLPWIVGFAVMGNLIENDREQGVRDQAQTTETREVAREAHGAARDAKAQAKTNKKVIACLTQYAVTATIALGSQSDWVRTFRTLVAEPPVGGPAVAREQFLDATAAHLRNLRMVRDVRLGQCVREIKDDPKVRAAAFELVAYERHRGTCLGKRVTIHGTKHIDIILGTKRADVIRTGRGSDLVAAMAGKDRICSGKGSDVVNGGRGFDRASCGRGPDTAQQTERQRSC